MRSILAVFALVLASLASTAKPPSSPTQPIATGTPRGSPTPPRLCASPSSCTSAAPSTSPPSPPAILVRVSADNRFILFVNGSACRRRPARGDLPHWRYERFDLAPFLHAGPNLITATVWNFGVYAPVAQMSDRTAFLLESEATGDSSISTPEGWQVEDRAGPHTPLTAPVTIRGLHRLRPRRGNRRRPLRLELELPLR